MMIDDRFFFFFFAVAVSLGNIPGCIFILIALILVYYPFLLVIRQSTERQRERQSERQRGGARASADR